MDKRKLFKKETLDQRKQCTAVIQKETTTNLVELEACDFYCALKTPHEQKAIDILKLIDLEDDYEDSVSSTCISSHHGNSTKHHSSRKSHHYSGAYREKDHTKDLDEQLDIESDTVYNTNAGNASSIETNDTTTDQTENGVTQKLAVDLYKLINFSERQCNKKQSAIGAWTTCQKIHNPHVIPEVLAVGRCKCKKTRVSSAGSTGKMSVSSTSRQRDGCKSARRSGDKQTLQGIRGFALQTTPIDSQYHFQHHKNCIDHIQQYNASKDPKNIPSSSSLLISPNHGNIIPKAHVECVDVRCGACIEPYSKVNVMKNMFKSDPRSGKSKSGVRSFSRGQAVTVKTPTEPLRVKGHSTLKVPITTTEAKMEVTIEEAKKKLKSAPHVFKQPSKPLLKISRSRPTIPSNARGKVYDSAVEMPQYTVSYVHTKLCDKPKIQMTPKSTSLYQSKTQTEAT